MNEYEPYKVIPYSPVQIQKTWEERLKDGRSLFSSKVMIFFRFGVPYTQFVFFFFPNHEELDLSIVWVKELVLLFEDNLRWYSFALNGR